jgi:hypothetical protein
MTNIKTVIMLAGLALAGAADAGAQTAGSNLYFDLNLAGQTQSVTLETSAVAPIFGEVGTASTSQTVGKGLLVDFGGGYRIRSNVAVGIAFSLFSRSPTGSVEVSVPDPIAFGAFTSLSAAPTLTQSEFGTHVKIAYLGHLSDKIDLVVSGGPSFVRLSKDIVGATLTGSSASITVERQTGSSVGVNGAVDLNYFFTQRLGGGVFARYVAASVDLPAASGLKVGGFQGGLGVRLRF